MKIKKRLTEEQEFEIMKLVMDKVLWAGFIAMGFGGWRLIVGDYSFGIIMVLAGAIVLTVFSWLIVKEFEYMK